MRNLILFFILFPALSFAQSYQHFSNDTVYTKCGYNFYEGQTIKIAAPTNNRKYRFIVKLREMGNMGGSTYEITKVKKLIVSGIGNRVAYLDGVITYHDSSKEKISLKIYVDRAIEPFAGLSPEIDVPEPYKSRIEKGSTADEIKKLKDLLDANAINQHEYDSLKNAVLSNHNL
ncbi:MAG TPA: hypothetical protein VKT28_19390 [Puia sp.]|nr:hypothetical protein [Puia sp.]